MNASIETNKRTVLDSKKNSVLPLPESVLVLTSKDITLIMEFFDVLKTSPLYTYLRVWGDLYIHRHYTFGSQYWMIMLIGDDIPEELKTKIRSFVENWISKSNVKKCSVGESNG